MRAHYEDATVTLHHGDCLDVLRGLPDASVDAVVTDPPYGLEFMGKEWDRFSGAVTDRDFKGFVLSQQRTRNVKCPECGKWAYDHPGRLCECGGVRRAQGNAFQEWCEAWSRECLRVLKPGGHMLAFGGTRTFHRLACAVEDAGFEVRDSIAWLYGSGFPKSLDVSKAIDKAAGAEREVVGSKLGLPGYSLTDGNGDHRTYSRGLGNTGSGEAECAVTAPATDAARTWQGWGTALKPAFEPVVVARKPLQGTVAANVLAHGTGALNVDGCRIEGGARPLIVSKSEDSTGILGNGLNGSSHGGETTAGRWPANVVLDESQAAALDEQSGELTSGKMMPTHTTAGTEGRATCYSADAAGGFTTMETYGDSGGASRFFYVAKADASERVRVNGTAHPTVKPLSLMRWLVRLVTPPGGTVLEPFAGSGTTVEACILEGFRCIAIEREADYLPLIVQRINRRRDPVEAVRTSGEDGGLFDLLDNGGAA